MTGENYNNRSDWYEPSEKRSDWYTTSPAERRSQPADGVPTPPPLPSAGASRSGKPKSSGRGWRIAALCLALVVVIGATSIIFSNSGSESAAPSPTPPTPTAPGYDDFREFFKNYYDDSAEITGENTIPEYKGDLTAYLPTAPKPDGEELSLGEIYDRCSPFVVAISAEMSRTSYSWGTGIVISSDGFILTNAHVLEGASSAVVTLEDDTDYDALLVGCDTISDLAVLKIEAKGLASAEFCATPVHQGDEVVAIGNPLGSELRGTMTNGIISAISRDISYNRHTMTLLQTNAAINEGNSGGPLINMYGQVVGVTNMKMMSGSLTSTVEGIGFAIPVETIKTVVDQLISDGRVTGRPAIGITIGAIPDSAKEQYKLPDGLYISEVAPGSDAEAKGLKEGDVLTAVNGEKVTAIDQVAAIKEGLKTGDTMLMTIFRDGEYFDVEIELVETSDIY